jgi:hypothetical protein
VTSKCPYMGGRTTGNSPKTAKSKSAKTNCNYASASAKNFISFTRGERKNCPAFFPIIRPDRTESAEFLALEMVILRSTFYFLPPLRQHLFRGFCVVETTRLNFEALLRQCRVAFALTPLARPRLDKSSQRAARRATHAAALKRSKRNASRFRSGRSLVRFGKCMVPPSSRFKASSIGPSFCPSSRSDT